LDAVGVGLLLNTQLIASDARTQARGTVPAAHATYSRLGEHLLGVNELCLQLLGPCRGLLQVPCSLVLCGVQLGLATVEAPPPHRIESPVHSRLLTTHNNARHHHHHHHHHQLMAHPPTRGSTTHLQDFHADGQVRSALVLLISPPPLRLRVGPQLVQLRLHAVHIACRRLGLPLRGLQLRACFLCAHHTAVSTRGIQACHKRCTKAALLAPATGSPAPQPAPCGWCVASLRQPAVATPPERVGVDHATVATHERVCEPPPLFPACKDARAHRTLPRTRTRRSSRDSSSSRAA